MMYLIPFPKTFRNKAQLSIQHVKPPSHIKRSERKLSCQYNMLNPRLVQNVQKESSVVNTTC